MSDSNHNSPPLVSVVLPTFNRPHYLAVALASALRQTYQNLEILVCDNASGPETQAAVARFADPRIRFERRPVNLGMTMNILTGCKAACGKYIAGLHDDDQWEPTFLEKLIPPLEANPELSLAFCDHYIMDETGQIDYQQSRKIRRQFRRHTLTPGVHQPFYHLALVEMSIPMTPAMVLRKAAIDWDDFPDLPGEFDYWMTYLACRNGSGAYYHPEFLTRYRVHDASETATGRIRVNQGFIDCYQRLLQDEQMKEMWPVFRKRMYWHYLHLGCALIRDARPFEARTPLWTSWHHSPAPLAVAALLLSLLPAQMLKLMFKRAEPSCASHRANSSVS